MRDIGRDMPALDVVRYEIVDIPDPAAAGRAVSKRSARPAFPVVVGLVALLAVAGVASVSDVLADRSTGAATALAPSSPVPSPSATTVPSDWQRVPVHGLAIPIPPNWEKTIDTNGKSDRPDPSPPQILYFEDRGAGSGTLAARRLAIWIWQTTSVDELVRTRFGENSLSVISRSTVLAARPMREVIGVATWNGPTGAGSYEARSLFVQVDPERVIQVTTFGAQVASTRTEPTSEMRSIQEIIAFNVASIPPSGCPVTRSSDEWGVITVDRKTGILDRTYSSANDMNGSFVMLRRGAVTGDRVGVEFRQLGTTAPASWVAYSVAAEPRPTAPGVVATPWDGAAFKLGVKPIGFDNSCWRLIVNGADSGIVLFVGP